MNVLIKQWNIYILILTLFDVTYALNCTSNVCYVKPGTKSFAEQVIEAASIYSNGSFTILAYAGNYNATNGDLMNFINFTNVAFKKHPDNTMPVNILCPRITLLSGDHNGIGFENSKNIDIVSMNFMSCGTVTSGLFFFNTFNVTIHDSTFHQNTDNGIQILFGNNFSIVNCSFYSNIGLQPDRLSDLITDDVIKIRGVGLGLFFEDQNNISVTVKDCNFTNNVAYKPPDYNTTIETRPYGFIPFGNGGGIYLKLNRVNGSFINILNTSFYNNTAIHQGGALVMIPVNSTDNILNVFGCKFVGNKVLGTLLRSLSITVNNISFINTFIDLINQIFSIINLNSDTLRNVDFSRLRQTGGSGGAIAVSLFGSVERNILRVNHSHFIENAAFLAGAINFVVQDLLSEIEDGIDSNQAFINNCNFDHNIALSGSAVQVASYSRVDIASLPIQINNCIFKNNDNLRNRVLPPEFVNLFGTSGTVVGIRFPVSFNGTNLFQSNLGGGVNMDYTRVSIQGHMKLYDNHESIYGGAIRLGELTLMHVFPNTILEFINNSASDFGGGLAVDNFLGGNDTTLILNNFCFIQYNIGGQYEYEQNNWNVTFTFANNTVTNENGQGQAFYAEDIANCVLGPFVHSTSQIFNSSIFSTTSIFNFGQENSIVETAPHALILENSTVEVSLGEIFELVINAIDENGNSKDAVYSYHSPRNPTIRPLNTIAINIDSVEDVIPSFASVTRATMQNPTFTVQKITLVMHFAEQLKSSCVINNQNLQHFNFSFRLNLIDSSDGQVVNTAVINSVIRCCHAAYEYDIDIGECVFIYSRQSSVAGSSVILREDMTNKKYIYIRSDRYGGFNSDRKFVTATIPPSYQNCVQDANLPGCIVKDDKPDDQCTQGRTGFLCGRCANDANQGTALSLIECVSCEDWHAGIFAVICVLIVVISFSIIYHNVVLPNALKGFLFFIQVIGYVYRIGVKGGQLKWDFYLSRFFGFSLYFPICISSNLDTVNVAMLGFITPLLMAICTIVYIFLARFIPHLSRRKTVDGIWFLILIAYVYTADTCLNLLRCVQVHEPIEFGGKRVYYFDGELECFKGKHLPYGVIAVIISIVILLSLPFYILTITFNLYKKGGPLRDVISRGIKKEYHWWSGYDLFRRLLFFVVYLLCENLINDYTQFALTFVALLILMITSRIQPYTRRWANFAEGLILLDLVFISAYFLDYNRLSTTSNSSFIVALLILPFIYFFLYLLMIILCKWCPNYIASRDVLSHNFGLVSKYWNSVLKTYNTEHSTSFTSPATDEDAMYEEYRDELVPYATVKD